MRSMWHHVATREWLRGRASPCQGEGRGFKSHLPLHHGDVAKWQGRGLQNPHSAVRIRPSPPVFPTAISHRASVGIGRRGGLKILWPDRPCGFDSHLAHQVLLGLAKDPPDGTRKRARARFLVTCEAALIPAVLRFALPLHFLSPLPCLFKQILADIEVKDSRSH